MKEKVVSIDLKNKPQDLSWGEFLLLQVIGELDRDSLVNDSTLIESLEKKDYLLNLELGIAVTKKFVVKNSYDVNTITDVIKHYSKEMELKRGISVKSAANRQLVQTRLNEGYSKEDIMSTLTFMIKDWAGDMKMAQYRTLQTLLSNKFSGYFVRMQQSTEAEWKTDMK